MAPAQTIVALGDSLTQGYGLPAEDGFVPTLMHWLAENGHDVNIVNAGVSGDTTAGGLARTDWSLEPGTDAVIVNLGGNDLLRGLDPAQTRANLDGILDKIDAKGLPVLLIGLHSPVNFGADYQAAFNAIYPDLAQEHDALLLPDYFTPLVRDGRLDPALMQADGIHPNATGVKRAVEEVGPAVLKLLEQIN
ncbi:arylesterase [Falsirhodobacter sp. alg1]|uniref:arylesterase n=1 Tax=Falsirhodobacter sp. alg1 TaxID=1472418 RepID=UPI001EDC2FE1|nr:arylesterase [Falsirhodobacter sp. alg1]